MSAPTARRLVYAALALLYLLHNDVWYWRELTWLGPLPAGFLYHVAYCLAAAAVMALAVRWAWPGPQNSP